MQLVRWSTKPRNCAVAIILCLIGGPVEARPLDQATLLPAINRAIRDYECFHVFWNSRSLAPPRGSTISAAIRFTDDIAHVWVEGLERAAGIPQLDSYFLIAQREGKAAVASAITYNHQTMRESADFQSNRGKVFDGQSQMIGLGVPTDCRPRFDAHSPETAQMIRALRASIQNYFTLIDKDRLQEHAMGLPIIIGKFNLGDPEILVLVPQLSEVLHVAPGTAATGDGSGLRPDMVVRPEYDQHSTQVLARKIRANGIPSEINVTVGRD